MFRFAPVGLVIFVMGCHLPGDQEPLRPLPEGMTYSYLELLHRVRSQATGALEAFYVDSWADVEDAAKGLEQTARFLPQAMEQPERLKDRVALASATLRKEAVSLGEAARTKNVAATNESLERINMQIRELRLGP